MAVCACEAVQTSTTEQAGINMQGINLQGINLQGISLQGINLLGFRFDGATLSGSALENVRVERGAVVAELRTVTLRGAALVGAHLLAEARNLQVTPPETAVIEYRITAVAPELSQYDPTKTGNTFLYTLEQWLATPARGSRPARPIPMAAASRSRWPPRGTSTAIGSSRARCSRSAARPASSRSATAGDTGPGSPGTAT